MGQFSSNTIPQGDFIWTHSGKLPSSQIGVTGNPFGKQVQQNFSEARRFFVVVSQFQEWYNIFCNDETDIVYTVNTYKPMKIIKEWRLIFPVDVCQCHYNINPLLFYSSG